MEGSSFMISLNKVNEFERLMMLDEPAAEKVLQATIA